MHMWLLIIGGAFLLAVIAAGFVVNEVRKTFFLRAFAQGGKWKSILLGIAVVITTAFLIAMLIGTVNMIVVFLHFAIIILICKALAKCITVFGRKAADGAEETSANSEKGRKKAFLAAVIITLLYLAYGYYMAHNVIETKYSIDSEGAEPLRIVQIADSHIGATMDGEQFAKYMQDISSTSPDIVLVTGDFVDESTDSEELKKATAALGKIKTKYGVFYSEGNHDRGYMRTERLNSLSEELIDELTKNGITILGDESVNIGEDYVLLGRLDKYNESRKPIAELMDDIKNAGNGGRYSIVMDHQPADFDAEAKAGCNLVLSGHTHGGQLVPFLKAGELLGMNDATYGHERRGNTDFVITSGIGDWNLLFKTGCVSEYVVIDLENHTEK